MIWLRQFIFNLKWSKENRQNNQREQGSKGPRDHAPLTSCRALFPFIHLLDNFHGAVVRTRLYSQEIAHHWIKIKNGERLYLVTHFKCGSLSK